MFGPRASTTASLELSLAPAALVAAWRTADRRLVLTVAAGLPSPLRRVSARLRVAGLGAAATITGRVARTRRTGSALVLEVTPDDGRIMALERLVKIAASGTPVADPPREPRLLAPVPAVVLAPGCAPTFMYTLDVSRSGCALAWSAPGAPAPGDRAGVRLGAAKDVAAVICEVRWVRSAGPTTFVGLRITEGDRDAWARLHAKVRQAGAPLN
jgi:hypothetical protein